MLTKVSYTKMNQQKGFTLVELAVVIVAAGILAGILFGALNDLYSSSSRSLARTIQDTDTRSVLRSIENTLVSVAGFKSDQSTVSPLGNNDTSSAWNFKGSDASRRVLIAETYATDIAEGVDSNNTRMPILLGSDCTAYPTNPTVAPAFAKNAQIYFAARDATATHPDGSAVYNLYRRTIVGINGNPCKTIAQKQTCTSSKVQSNPLVCKGSDAILLKDIASFDIKYYAPTNTEMDVYNDNDIPENAKSAVINVATNTKISGSNSLSNAQIRISKPY
jgi:prepilin-type N-terminal cleavage/methylation domain-containing protein